ncbi:hypothetical protein [Vibrio mexicanus]|uniref:hypothetical protein n=1 Tax=Vibrio mexicanus TaxID=1004326 RepID=UPI0012F797EE|nr:hypothetical protein [Vibrio mexicanus]
MRRERLQLLSPIFGTNEDGELITSSHTHSIRIYQKYEQTGLDLDDEGSEYPIMTPVDAGSGM